jgi:bile acid:Na+ symporter, BASS family
MPVITEWAIPLIVVLLMLAAGTGISAAQFRLVLQSPVALIGGTLAQALLLPLLALGLIVVARPAPELAAGLILVAASPGGALSNFYCYLGRLDVSLSVMLTTLSTLVSFIVLPLALVLAPALPAVGPNGVAVVPVGEIMVRLIFFLLLPVGVGMVVRHFVPEWVERSASRLRAVGLLLVVALITLIVLDQWQTVVETYREAVSLGILFTGAAIVAGWVVGAGCGLGADGRRVFAIEFAIRNLGAAALIASASLGRPDFLAFGAIFVGVQLPIVLLLLLAWRARIAATAG